MRYHHLATAFRKFLEQCSDHHRLFPAGVEPTRERSDAPLYGVFNTLDNDQLTRICAILDRHQYPKHEMYAVTYSRWDIDHSKDLCDYTVYPVKKDGDKTFVITRQCEHLIANGDTFEGGWHLCDVEGNVLQMKGHS